MNFDFTEEQTMLRDTVRRYVQDNYGFEARKQIVDNGGFSQTVWADLAQLGVLGLTAPADAGGSEMGAQETMVVMEELGRGIVVEPVAALSVMPTVILSGKDAFIELLSGIADGSKRVSVAYIEHANRYHWHSPKTTAHAVGQQWHITGGKGIIAAADTCDAFIVSAASEQGFGLWLVDAHTQGVSVSAYGTQDGGRAGEVQFNKALGTCIAQSASAVDLMQQAMNALIAAHCAQAIGAMEVLCEMTVDYLNTRKQFGIAIGTFQALRHRLVDMRLELELARGMSWKANMAVSDTSISLSEQTAVVSATKVAVGKAMRIVGQGAVQLHGGIGVTLEYAAGHYFKHLTALEMTAGDTLHHMAVLSDTQH